MKKITRPIRVEGDIAFVPLTKGYEAIIDAADAELVGRWNWHARVVPHTVYAVRAHCSGGKQSLVSIHRLLMAFPEELEVDHRDCNGLNNRRSNLRLATGQQNQHNQRLSRANTSGFKGVSRHKRTSKWQASIKLSGKRRHLGFFETATEAHAAYCAASAALHGEFGRTA